MKFIQSLRQWAYPKEYRINALESPPELPEALEQLSPTALPAQDSVPISILADVGTGLWRLQQTMLQPGTELPLEEMRRAYRHLQSTLDALDRANIHIHDHTGELVPEGGGLKLKILAYQPLAEITHKQVMETIKPTIYYKDEMVQMGEVIVSIPDESNS